MLTQKKLGATKTRWRLANPEKMDEYRAAWDAANPVRKRIHRENRRAREASAPGRMSVDIVEKLMLLQKCCCAVCRKDIKKKYELDHVFPLFLGGSNDDANLQLLCVTCNRSKGHKNPVDFMQSRGMLL